MFASLLVTEWLRTDSGDLEVQCAGFELLRFTSHTTIYPFFDTSQLPQLGWNLCSEGECRQFAQQCRCSHENAYRCRNYNILSKAHYA